MLSSRGLCDELITRPEESYRLWRVVVCDLETSKEEAKSPLKGYEYKATIGCEAETERERERERKREDEKSYHSFGNMKYYRL